MRTLRLAITIAFSAFAVACGGSGKPPQQITTSGQNVAAISVNGGPTGNYVNGGFVSVTLCLPSSSNCQTIPDVLVDTGSTGLRIVSSVLTISLPQQTGANSAPVAECLPFISGFTWGPVQTADIKIASETASAVPIQVLNDSAFITPSSCTKFGGPALDTVSSLGANGILGVGLFAQDCGGACAQTGAANPGLYYLCPTSGCQIVAQSRTQQVQNPVALFATDNNGVIIEIPAVSSPQPTVTGSLLFGIGTQSNNALGSATVYTTNNLGNFTTTFKGQAYPSSFIDSGSNGYFFLTSSLTGLPGCTVDTGFYCPTSTANVAATNQGANGASGTLNFGVVNAENVFSIGTNSVFNNLAGPQSGGFDWGLPFFFGRNVFVGIEGKTSPGGTGPYWAY
jgi:Protein of unknown function (DUF3443)